MIIFIYLRENLSKRREKSDCPLVKLWFIYFFWIVHLWLRLLGLEDNDFFTQGEVSLDNFSPFNWIKLSFKKTAFYIQPADFKLLWWSEIWQIGKNWTAHLHFPQIKGQSVQVNTPRSFSSLGSFPLKIRSTPLADTVHLSQSCLSDVLFGSSNSQIHSCSLVLSFFSFSPFPFFPSLHLSLS